MSVYSKSLIYILLVSSINIFLVLLDFFPGAPAMAVATTIGTLFVVGPKRATDMIVNSRVNISWANTIRTTVSGLAFTIILVVIIWFMDYLGLLADAPDLIAKNWLFVLCNAFVLPLNQEIFWRGELLYGLEGSRKCDRSLLIRSNLMFCLYHMAMGDYLSRQLFIFTIGYYFGWVFINCGFLYSVIMHILLNLTASLM